MANSQTGYEKKRERLARSQGTFERFEAEESLEIVIFGKGDMRGILEIRETAMLWEAYADADFTQHLDWNAPECYPQFTRSRQKMSPLWFTAMLIEDGWSPVEKK